MPLTLVIVLTGAMIALVISFAANEIASAIRSKSKATPSPFTSEDVKELLKHLDNLGYIKIAMTRTPSHVLYKDTFDPNRVTDYEWVIISAYDQKDADLRPVTENIKAGFRVVWQGIEDGEMVWLMIKEKPAETAIT